MDYAPIRALKLNDPPEAARQNHTFVRLGKAVKKAILAPSPFKQKLSKRIQNT
jgi:hypothetical protein